MIANSPERELLNISSQSEADAFVAKWCGKTTQFHEAINAIAVAKKISLAELMKNSNINRNYGYNIINGRRLYPGRDKVLALCVAAKASVEEAQELLSIAKVGSLYYRDQRDVRIAAALNSGVGNVVDLNIILESNGLESLDV